MAIGLNHYSELLRYIHKLLKSDKLINTISQGEFDKVDLNKMNIYPLAHVYVGDGSFSNGQNVSFNVSVAAMNVRDTNPEVNEDKFWGNENDIDNYNEMYAVLNRLWSSMHLDFQYKGIIASENPSVTKRSQDQDKNSLEGWQLEFTVQMPNTALNLCS